MTFHFLTCQLVRSEEQAQYLDFFRLSVSVLDTDDSACLVLQQSADSALNITNAASMKNNENTNKSSNLQRRTLSPKYTVVSNQQSYSTGGPVSTWMGDYLRAGKPSRYEASQLGRLSLLPSVGW